MDEFVRVFSLDEVAPGTARVTTIGDYEVAVFNVDGTLYAIDELSCRRAVARRRGK
jgi:nitrite reductase/ring-hydroxylating ferredoxin subunit